MRYLVHSNGQKYGPADLPTLIQWANDGRLVADTILEDELGKSRLAGELLPFGTFPGQPIQTTTYHSSQSSQNNQNYYNPGPFTQYPRYQGLDDAEAQRAFNNALIFSGISLFCCPLVGIAAVYYASNAIKYGHKSGKVAMGIAVFSLLAFFLLNLFTRVLR